MEFEASVWSTLAFSICFIAALWIWNNRRLLALSFKLRGPLPIPYLGCLPLFYKYWINDDKRVAIRSLRDLYKQTTFLWHHNYQIVLFDAEDVASYALTTAQAKSPMQCKYWASAFGDGILAHHETHATWKLHRKMIESSMHIDVVKVYFEDVYKHCTYLLNDMGKLVDSGLANYKMLTRRYMGDLISESFYGISTSYRKGVNDDIFHAFHVVDLGVLEYYSYPWYMIDFLYKRTELYRSTMDASKVMAHEMRKIFDCYIQNKSISSKTNLRLIDVLMNAHLNEELTETEVLGELGNTWTAAVDEAAAVLNFCILTLGIHKRCQDKAFAEIKMLCNGDRNKIIKFDELEQLPYLTMCINEIIRLFGPGPLTGRYANRDILLKSRNITIPTGVHVVIPQLILHRDPRYWEKPDEFVPERFSQENIHKIKPFSYLPFGGGKRKCPGKPYAMAAVNATMFYLLKNFEFESDWDFQQLPLTQGINFHCTKGYFVKITDRKWN